MSTQQEWADLSAGLPAHEDEVMAAHQGAPSIAVQDATHGAPSPAEDRGAGGEATYGPLPPAC